MGLDIIAFWFNCIDQSLQGLKSCDSPHFSASIADEVGDSYFATAVMSANKEFLILEDEVSWSLKSYLFSLTAFFVCYDNNEYIIL